MAGDNATQTAVRFVKHTLFSLIGTATNTLVMWVCSHYLFTGEIGRRVISPFLAFEIANVVNFVVSSNLVFQDRNVESGIKGALKRFVIYNLSYSASFLLNLGLLQLFIWLRPGWEIVVLNFISLAISGILNFIMNTFVTFRDKK